MYRPYVLHHLMSAPVGGGGGGSLYNEINCIICNGHMGSTPAWIDRHRRMKTLPSCNSACWMVIAILLNTLPIGMVRFLQTLYNFFNCKKPNISDNTTASVQWSLTVLWLGFHVTTRQKQTREEINHSFYSQFGNTWLNTWWTVLFYKFVIYINYLFQLFNNNTAWTLIFLFIQ